MLELGEFPLLNFYEMDLSIFQVGWSSTGLAAVSITNMVVTEFGPEKTMHFPAYVARRNLTPSSPKENIGPWIHSEGHFWYRGSATNQSQEQRLTAFLRQQLEAGNKTLGKTEFDGWECVTTWFASTSCASIYIYIYIYLQYHVFMYRLSMDIAKNGDSKNMVTFRAAHCKDVPQQEAGCKCCERYVLALRKSLESWQQPSWHLDMLRPPQSWVGLWTN